ncbi:MAG TPA: transporter substrate-binding domain-containing protein [Candidatus Ventricola gallistercoris]|nr:transporter substrate-binding domain-containing protein [Candidatus Ventricola gallistercoris]
MKKIFALALAMMLLMTCSVALADRLADIQAAGKLVVATSPDWPPYEYIDDDGNIVGTDILMCEWMAEQLGVELEIQPMNFDACLAAVGQGDVDLMVAGLTYDEERLTRMELTGVYWNEGDQGLLVKKGEGANYTAAADFDGKVVAAQNGTNQQIMVEEQLTGATLELVTKIPDGVNMVKTGRVDALAVPKTVYDSVLAENDDLEVATFAFDFEGGNYIASVKGEDTLTAKIQELIDQINAEGLYQQWVDQITLGK